jgi:predicted 3-demethylubiquinone-9 3-methyltransferase (glyoxalase superfamily)
MAISAGPLFKFNPFVSSHIKCGTTQEVDAVWQRLSPRDKILMPLDKYPFSKLYGWVEDRYGLWWQVIHAGSAQVLQKIHSRTHVHRRRVPGRRKRRSTLTYRCSRTRPVARPGTRMQRFWHATGKGQNPNKEGSVRYARFSLLGQEFRRDGLCARAQFRVPGHGISPYPFFALAYAQDERSHRENRYSGSPVRGYIEADLSQLPDKKALLIGEWTAHLDRTVSPASHTFPRTGFQE